MVWYEGEDGVCDLNALSVSISIVWWSFTAGCVGWEVAGVRSKGEFSRH